MTELHVETVRSAIRLPRRLRRRLFPRLVLWGARGTDEQYSSRWSQLDDMKRAVHREVERRFLFGGERLP